MQQASSKRPVLESLHAPRTLFLLGGIVCLGVLVVLLVTACREFRPVRKSLVPVSWTTGFWHWRARWPQYGNAVEGGDTDLLYVEVGFPASPECNPKSPVEERVVWPSHLPRAAAYVVLLRWEGAAVPPPDRAPRLVETYRSLKTQAAAAGQRVTGFQLDFDCPVARLEHYARFLQSLREVLPADDWLSITALLDWFRPGTRVAEALRWVDEYVPQFYDVGALAGDEGTEIAMPIDPGKWAPVFNAYGRPYRIGVSVFGRIASIREGPRSPSNAGSPNKRFFRELRPTDVLNRKELHPVSESRSKAGETILRFTVEPHAGAQACCFITGERVEVVLPTAESVLTAYRAAQDFGGFCTGVVFFRWPADSDAMILRPEEIRHLLATGTLAIGPSRIEAVEGFCSAVTCVDLYLRLGDRFPKQSISLRLQASADLEYFLPMERIPARVTGRRTIDVQLPAYVSVPRLRLGRAVTREPATFRLEDAR